MQRQIIAAVFSAEVLSIVINNKQSNKQEKFKFNLFLVKFSANKCAQGYACLFVHVMCGWYVNNYARMGVGMYVQCVCGWW